jgi:hypothetical protein
MYVCPPTYAEDSPLRGQILDSFSLVTLTSSDDSTCVFRAIVGHPVRMTLTVFRLYDLQMVFARPAAKLFNCFYLFNRSRSRLLGRKETICRLVMVMEAPVLGLRPRRGALSRTNKVPNWTSFTDSPATMVYFKVAKTAATISAAFLCGTPNFSFTDSANSLRVTFFFFIL